MDANSSECIATACYELSRCRRIGDIPCAGGKRFQGELEEGNWGAGTDQEGDANQLMGEAIKGRWGAMTAGWRLEAGRDFSESA